MVPPARGAMPTQGDRGRDHTRRAVPRRRPGPRARSCSRRACGPAALRGRDPPPVRLAAAEPRADGSRKRRHGPEVPAAASAPANRTIFSPACRAPMPAAEASAHDSLQAHSKRAPPGRRDRRRPGSVLDRRSHAGQEFWSVIWCATARRRAGMAFASAPCSVCQICSISASANPMDRARP
jgi:hypothetical protein